MSDGQAASLSASSTGHKDEPPSPSQINTQESLLTRIVTATAQDVQLVSPSTASGSGNGCELTQTSSIASRRRESFSLSAERDYEEIAELKKTVSNEWERRRSIASIEEVVPEQALYTGGVPSPVDEMSEESSEKAGRGTKVEGVEEKLTRLTLEHDVPGSTSNKESVDSEMLYELPSRDEIAQSEHTEKKTSAVEDEEAMLEPASLVDTSIAVASPQSEAKTPAKDEKIALKTPRSTKSAILKAKEPANHNDTPKTASPKSVKAPHRIDATSTPRQTSVGTLSKTASTPKASSSAKRIFTGPSKATPAASSTPPKSRIQASAQANLSPRLLAPTASSAAKVEQLKPTTENKSPATKPSTTKPVMSMSSHLLKPTAASAAKHEHQENEHSKLIPSRTRTTTDVSVSSRLLAPTASSSKYEHQESEPSKLVPNRTRTTTEVSVSSRLLVPTASSSAKHDNTPVTKPEPTARKVSAPIGKDRPNGLSKTSASTSHQAAKTSRSSLSGSTFKRPESRSRVASSGFTTNGTKPAASSEGFLARMTRPTAASSSRTQGKADPKTSPAPASGSGMNRAASMRKRPAALSAKKKSSSTNVNGVSKTVKEQVGEGESGVANIPKQEESSAADVRGMAETPDFGGPVIR